MSKMESTQHDRGWELAADDNGTLSVALVNQRAEGKTRAKRNHSREEK